MKHSESSINNRMPMSPNGSLHRNIFFYLCLVVISIGILHYPLIPKWLTPPEFEDELTNLFPVGTSKDNVEIWLKKQKCGWWVNFSSDQESENGIDVEITNNRIPPIENIYGPQFMRATFYFNGNNQLTKINGMESNR